MRITSRVTAGIGASAVLVVGLGATSAFAATGDGAAAADSHRTVTASPDAQTSVATFPGLTSTLTGGIFQTSEVRETSSPMATAPIAMTATDSSTAAATRTAGTNTVASSAPASTAAVAAKPVAASPRKTTYSDNLTGWIAEARDILKADGDLVPSAGAIRSRAMIESSGNPLAENHWDVNQALYGGTYGLLQCIQPTFNEYSLPGHKNILNPVDSIIAGVRYANARYGSFTETTACARLAGHHSTPGYCPGGATEECCTP